MGCCFSKKAQKSPSQSSIVPEEDGTVRQVSSVSTTDDASLNHSQTSAPISELRSVASLSRTTVYPSLVKIAYAPASDRHKCAYCNNPTGDLYDYFHVFFTMSYAHYEEFMEHGWWRTGKLIFRPRFDVVCCPGYATRLPVEDYILTKNHRRVIRKWAAFLKNGDSQWKGAAHHDGVPLRNKEKNSGPVPRQKSSSKVKTKKEVRPGLGPDPTKPPCKKAKDRRAELLKTKNHPSVDQSQLKSPPISLQQFIDNELRTTLTGVKHRLTVKLVPCTPLDPLLRATIPKAYQLYNKLQNIVHVGKTRFDSEEQFRFGFCSSCLVNSSDTDKPQGSYHLQYYLDDQLMMYSVVDITPRYFVSVYFVYDPDIRFMSPGIFTCLYEMSLVQKLRQTMPSMKYYGLGYYNHFDDKSRYKRQFKPQEVLCNETNVFVSLEDAVSKFKEHEYHRLTADDIPEKEGRNGRIDLITVSKKRVTLGMFYTLPDREKERYRDNLKLFVQEAGTSAAQGCNVDLMANFDYD